MYNYKLVIQYDGTRYDGWQRMGKDESINTIEYKIAEILRKMTGEEIQIFCGCRTEKGVHARGQVINFKLDEQKKPYEVKIISTDTFQGTLLLYQQRLCRKDFTVSLMQKERYMYTSLTQVMWLMYLREDTDIIHLRSLILKQ